MAVAEQHRLQVQNLSSVANEYEPKFSWDRVPGAANYEVEVNSAQDFAPGSKVCCTDKSIGTSLAPKKVFPNNTYYWRVRALDPNGISGVWNSARSSTRRSTRRSRTCICATTTATIAPGNPTETPIIAWDPVAGRGELRRSGASMDRPAGPQSGRLRPLNPSRWSPRRTQRGRGWLRAARPVFGIDRQQRVERRSSLTGAAYCVAVRARAALGTTVDRVRERLDLPQAVRDLPAFTYTAHPVSGSNTAVTANDYLGPTQGAVTPRMPLFTWEHIAGACGYFVVVAKDEDFTHVVDVARTKIPAYAPRKDRVHRREHPVLLGRRADRGGRLQLGLQHDGRTTRRGTSARTRSHRP